MYTMCPWSNTIHNSGLKKTPLYSLRLQMHGVAVQGT